MKYRNTLKRVITEVIKPHWMLVALTIFLMIVIAATNSYQAYLIQPAVDETFFSNSTKDSLIQIPLLILVVTIAKGIATYYQQVLGTMISNKMINEVRLKMFSAFVKSDLEYYNNSSSGKMISNILNDINGMMNAVQLMLSGVFKNFFSVVFLFSVMIYMNPTLTFVSLIGLPLAAYPLIVVYKKIRKYMGDNQTRLEMFTVLMDDSLRSVRVVKSYNAEDYEIGRVRNSLNGLFKLNFKIARVSNIPSPLNEALIGVGTAAVLMYGGGLVMGGHSTPGSFFSFFAALMMAYRPLKSIGGLNVQLQMGLICAQRVFNILDAKPTIVDKPDAIDLSNVKGNIKFENVEFNYVPDKKALDGINLDLEAGKSYAFVGHSGGGKSTIMNLLLRFYDVKSGKISVDDHDVRDVTMKSLRDNISYVGQDVQLFDDTILENIKYSNQNATFEEVVYAAKMAEAHDFITQIPEGYNYRIGQNGQKLSGGQRQRISIARAFLRNTPILLLDEATSALDPISEKQIQVAIKHLMEGKTTLVIAHRLSTVISADKIFVMNHGKIVEEGKHEELLKKNGEYAILYSKQFQE